MTLGAALRPPVAQAGWRLVAKRAVDVVLALVVLVLAAPLLVVCAVAILIETGPPVIYRSVRLGKDHRPFEMLKLRSMVVDADDAPHREFVVRALSDSTEIGAGETKMRRDPRVTRVGRVMRRTSVDELQQLLNVIRGDMSLVGPRPDLPYAVECYDPRHHRRFDVLPGMTGLWQVSGRSFVDVRQMLELDLEYVERWSIGLDLQILARTIPSLLSKRGAGA